MKRRLLDIRVELCKPGTRTFTASHADGNSVVTMNARRKETLAPLPTARTQGSEPPTVFEPFDRLTLEERLAASIAVVNYRRGTEVA